MQFALMIYAEPGQFDGMSEAEYQAVAAEYLALLDDPRCIQAARLEPIETATAVRVQGGRTLLTDGPFADTKEVLGGLCLVEVANLDEAIDLAARIPAARMGGTVEVRPLAPR
jgi:hypothetical protein